MTQKGPFAELELTITWLNSFRTNAHWTWCIGEFSIQEKYTTDIHRAWTLAIHVQVIVYQRDPDRAWTMTNKTWPVYSSGSCYSLWWFPRDFLLWRAVLFFLVWLDHTRAGPRTNSASGCCTLHWPEKDKWRN